VEMRKYCVNTGFHEGAETSRRLGQPKEEPLLTP
jgi:hypothetical protein